MRPIRVMSAVVFAFVSAAAAAPRTAHHHKHHAAFVDNDPMPPITVTKRSWLDPGPAVPEGSMENYVTASTVFNETPDQINQPSRFGNETLPRPLYPIGRPEPLAIFWTPPAPYPPQY